MKIFKPSWLAKPSKTSIIFQPKAFIFSCEICTTRKTSNIHCKSVGSFKRKVYQLKGTSTEFY